MRGAVAVGLLVLCAAQQQPVMRTCGDTNMDGTPDEFDCADDANSLAAEPASIACAGNPCAASECCTVEPFVIPGVSPCALPGQTPLEGQEPCPEPEPEPPEPEPEPEQTAVITALWRCTDGLVTLARFG